MEEADWYTHVDIEKGVDFLLGEIQRSLVVCTTRIDNHAVQSTAFFNDAINGSSDGGLICDVGLNGL